jgi:hypothetical protein
VLIQLAQEGLINPGCCDVATRLMAKGLIVDGPVPTIFNYTFRAFLQSIERRHVVHEWERMDGVGVWVVAGRLIGSSLAAGGIFYLLTQNFSVQPVLPIVSGTDSSACRSSAICSRGYPGNRGAGRQPRQPERVVGRVHRVGIGTASGAGRGRESSAGSSVHSNPCRSIEIRVPPPLARRPDAS